MIKAVLFDLDGVLVDACEWHYLAFNRALMEICGFEIGREEHYSDFNGLPTNQKLLMLELQGRLNSEDFDKVWQAKQDHTVTTIQEHDIDDPSKLELVRALKSKGIKVGCVTNSIRLTATLMLQKIDLLDELDLVITNEDVDFPKPAPLGYNKAMAALGVTPDETIIVEDSDKGYAAAIKTGCKDVRRVEDATFVTVGLFKDVL